MSVNLKKFNLPNQPGCYLMKNKSGEIIYIGKAKNLKKRVSSYFRKNHEDFKTNELVGKIHDLEFIVTRNEVEALILEARFIKQHQPRYNMVLKENQPYAYIKITDEEFPRLMITRRIDKDGKYFGPYVSGRGRRALVWTTARLFGLRTGKMTSHSSKELYKLLTEIKEQKLKGVSPENYAKNVKLAELFLRGKKEKLIKVFEQRMKQASREQNFELAKIYRDQLQSLKNIIEEQLVYLPKSYDQDIINYLLIDQRLHVQIFHITKGVITARQEYQLPLENNEIGEAVGNFLEQYYLTRSLPKEIIIPAKLPEQKLLADYLSEIKGEKVLLTIPKQGDRKELLELV
ncbi:MAG: excinuclease ABC subunit UvrC, partial [Candidatus Parcubacteria bacterium]|nr:excinuclease ABC subunit UvrC [Candidatus Parcubacteria bacterium]